MNNEKAENIIGALVLTLSDALLTASQSKAPANISAAGLTLVGHEPGITIQDLSHGLSLSHPGAVRLVDRMVADGLVARNQSTEDKRAVALFLTPAGQKQEQSILSSRNKVLSDAMSFLSDKEVNALAQISEKLLGALLIDEAHALKICRLCDGDMCEGCPIEAELLRQAAD